MYCNSICSRFGEHLEENLPKLDTLIMTNNNIQELADIETLSSVKTLTMLSLLHNPVVAKPNYRLFVIHRFPNLRVLDFKKVKAKERDDAKALFKTRKGKDQLKEIREAIRFDRKHVGLSFGLKKGLRFRFDSRLNYPFLNIFLL